MSTRHTNALALLSALALPDRRNARTWDGPRPSTISREERRRRTKARKAAKKQRKAKP